MPGMVTETHASNLGVFKDDQTVTSEQFAQIQDDSTLDAALIAKGYTAEAVSLMSKNDKIFAWRDINNLQA